VRLTVSEEADADAAAAIRGRLRELAALKAGRERELEVAERALAAKPDRDEAHELVDLLPQLDVDTALLADESFRDLLAALDFRATFEPDRNELRMRAVLAPDSWRRRGTVLRPLRWCTQLDRSRINVRR
jgi:hypothetical protein